jgi:hypothetical protein
MSAGEVTDRLGLHSLLRSRNWYMQAQGATSGDGLLEGLSWLLDSMALK